MATLKAVLELSSSSLGPDKLYVPIIENISVQAPFTNMGNMIALTGGTVILPNTNAKSVIYLRNIDPTNIVTVSNTAAVTLAILQPLGGIAFFTLAASSGLKITASVASCTVEVGYWTRT